MEINYLGAHRMKLPLAVNNLKREYDQDALAYEKKAIEVLRSGWYIMGPELQAFEEEWAKYNGASYGVGVASGLDALWIAVHSLGIGHGDEVIVQGNTYIASVMSITINGAIPVFVEPDKYYGIDADKIEEKITDKTKAVIVVHLYGIPCDMDKITQICKKHNLFLIEDCAQSHGAEYKGSKTGTFGDAGCFSFYPTKNLGAFGDGGAVITDKKELSDEIRIFRNYGSEKRYYNKEVGANSRLDELQAGLLRVKLKKLDEACAERQMIAKRYLAGIHNSKIILPEERPGSKCVWHQFVIRSEHRDALAQYLSEHQIGTLIHYPVPPHLSEAYSYLGYKKGDLPITEKIADTVLSIPMYTGLTEEEQVYVIDALNKF